MTSRRAADAGAPLDALRRCTGWSVSLSDEAGRSPGGSALFILTGEAGTRMSRVSAGLVGLLVIAILGAAGGYAYHQLRSILVLRVATGPASSFGAQFSSALVQLIAIDRPRLRVTTTPYATEQDAMKALESGEADVAIARADVGATPGLTIAVLRHDAGIFILPRASKIDSVAGLRGEKIGLVSVSPEDAALLHKVRETYALPATAEPLPLLVPDVADAIRTKKVGAIFVVGTVAGPLMTKTMTAVRTGGGGPPRVLEVDLAEAIVKRNPRLETVDLPEGVLLGSPPIPDDDATTLGVSTRLFASSRMPDAVAAELTRILLADKTKVASLLPRTAVIEAPDTDELNASLPIHPGAAGYVTGSQTSLSEQFQDYLYLIAIVGSLLASSAAALVAVLRRLLPSKPETTMQIVDLWVTLRETDNEADLQRVEFEVDRLVQEAARRNAAEVLTPTFSLIVSQVRRAIDQRRSELRSRPVGAPSV